MDYVARICELDEQWSRAIDIGSGIPLTPKENGLWPTPLAPVPMQYADYC